MRALVIVGVVATSFATVGCEQRVPQCNRLVDTINREQAKMAPVLAEAGGPEPTRESLEAYAKANDDLVAKLRLVKLADRKLAGFRDEYVALLQGLAAATRRTGERLESRQEAAKAAEDVKAYSPKKRDLDRSINEFCRGKTP